ncbi:hypothetical protein FD723_40025 (plasmid) [Nostoc sp. C052]|uniref:hypothetical protein n=1 Tax=Nostoc sp. C052 TaxID=2576902 RepID=UPI0015C37EFB|nr:hypothetical protein [Nostoc sp. C052]QLE46402.1 hypothetical protein FD723_40025 [Nostoc sp. C052]
MKVTIVKNEWGQLKAKLRKLEFDLPELGKIWATNCAQFFNTRYREHLRTQGRGGAGPRLSPVTLYLYNRRGNPDGSGIRNFIEIESATEGNKFRIVFGIKAGRASMIAKVQDRGATIKVTERMRGFLARNGVFLRRSTTHINVPGRRSWSETSERTREYAKSTLKEIFPKIREDN